MLEGCSWVKWCRQLDEHAPSEDDLVERARRVHRTDRGLDELHVALARGLLDEREQLRRLAVRLDVESDLACQPIKSLLQLSQVIPEHGGEDVALCGAQLRSRKMRRAIARGVKGENAMPVGIRRCRPVVAVHLGQIEWRGLIGWQRNGGHDVDAVELLPCAGMDDASAACLLHDAEGEVGQPSSERSGHHQVTLRVAVIIWLRPPLRRWWLTPEKPAASNIERSSSGEGR